MPCCSMRSNLPISSNLYRNTHNFLSGKERVDSSACSADCSLSFRVLHIPLNSCFLSLQFEWRKGLTRSLERFLKPNRSSILVAVLG